MTVNELSAALGCTAICLPEPERPVSGVYCGDLLSWVMGKAQTDNVWLTIMSNVNVLAVASLSDVSCVLLTEGVTLDDALTQTALQKSINVLSTSLPTYEAAAALHEAGL